MKTIEEILSGHEVRLFSAINISTEREAEMRATAAILSIVQAVSEFGRTLTKIAGGPFGNAKCFTEVELKNSITGKKYRPDGVISVTRGKKKWNAIVEVKVGVNGLKQDQFDAYHLLAREYGFDALITISNQAALPNGFPPLKVDLRRAKACPSVHLSWERLLSEAQLLSWQSGVADEDQRYILDEWIRYINDGNAKIIVAPRVGTYWDDLLKAAAADSLNPKKAELEDFINTWNGFLRIISFRLRALLGERVDVRSRGEEKKKPELHTKRLVNEAISNCKFTSNLVIPHTTSDLEITFDLRSRRVFFKVSVKAPTDKTSRGQIGWMLSQLKKLSKIPPQLLLSVDWSKKGLSSECLVTGIQENREVLLVDRENNAIPNGVLVRSFSLIWTTKLSRKKSVLFLTIGSDLENFYQNVVEQLVVYVPSAPKIIRTHEAESNSGRKEIVHSNKQQEPKKEIPSIIPVPPWLTK